MSNPFTRYTLILAAVLFAAVALNEFGYAATHHRAGPAWDICIGCIAGLLLCVAVFFEVLDRQMRELADQQRQAREQFARDLNENGAAPEDATPLIKLDKP